MDLRSMVFESLRPYQTRLRLAVERITGDPLSLAVLYAMPVALVDAYGILYSLGVLALLALMYRQSPPTQSVIVRPWWEKAAFWLLPVLVLGYQWVLDPRGWAKLPADDVFSIRIGGDAVSLFPGLVHLGVSYLLPLALLLNLRPPAAHFAVNRRIVLFIGLSILPVVLRNVFAIEELSGDRAAMLGLTLSGLQAFYIPGLGEELLYRGAIFTLLARRLRLFYAVVLSSLVFTLAHLNLIRNFWASPELAVPTAFNLAAVFALGCSMAIVYYRTRSLIPCVVFHGVIDGGFRYPFYALLLALGVGS